MDEIPDIETSYANKEIHMIMALRSIIPHPGVYLTNEDYPDATNQQLEDSMVEYDTSTLDMILILIRQLWSFGFNIDNDDTANSLSDEEKIYVKASQKDFGWDSHQDWKLKRDILNQINNTTNISGFTKGKTTFKEFYHQTLKSPSMLFNLQFMLVSKSCMDFSKETLVKLPESLHSLHKLKFDDSAPLSELVSRHFRVRDTHPEIQILSSCPRFLHIEYEVKSGTRPISTLRRLEFQAPIARVTSDNNGTIIHKRFQSPTYILCHVIRITDNKPEAIRTYWKTGDEALPAEVGNLELEKRPVELTNWSIKEVGVYVLFYYRQYKPKGWPDSELDIDAPEMDQKT